MIWRRPIPEISGCEPCEEASESIRGKPPERDVFDSHLESFQAFLKLLGANGEQAERGKKALESELESLRASHEKLEERRGRLAREIACAGGKLGQREKAGEQLLPCWKRQVEGLSTVLMIDVIHDLIDAIKPVSFPLDPLDLEVGDQLHIDVSLQPRPSAEAAPPLQMTSSFAVVPWGWGSGKPETPTLMSFIKSSDGDNFEPRPGVAALWHYAGKARKRTSWLRTLRPGFGIGAHFLDFDSDDSSIEIGLGITLTLFDDLLHFTVGENLQQKDTPPGVMDMEEMMEEMNGGGSRRYWGLGVSINAVVEKFGKKDE